MIIIVATVVRVLCKGNNCIVCIECVQCVQYVYYMLVVAIEIGGDNSGDNSDNVETVSCRRISCHVMSSCVVCRVMCNV